MLCVALGIERVLAVFSCIILDKYHDVNILLLSFKGDINGDFLPPTWKMWILWVKVLLFVYWYRGAKPGIRWYEMKMNHWEGLEQRAWWVWREKTSGWDWAAGLASWVIAYIQLFPTSVFHPGKGIMILFTMLFWELKKWIYESTF